MNRQRLGFAALVFTFVAANGIANDAPWWQVIAVATAFAGIGWLTIVHLFADDAVTTPADEVDG